MSDNRGERGGVEGRVSNETRHEALGAIDEQREHDAEEREARELDEFTVGQSKEDGAHDDAERDRGARRHVGRAVGDGTIDDAAKEPLFEKRRAECGHEGDEYERRAVRRVKEVIDRMVETFDVKGRVEEIDAQLARQAEHDVEEIARSRAPLIG